MGAKMSSDTVIVVLFISCQLPIPLRWNQLCLRERNLHIDTVCICSANSTVFPPKERTSEWVSESMNELSECPFPGFLFTIERRALGRVFGSRACATQSTPCSWAVFDAMTLAATLSTVHEKKIADWSEVRESYELWRSHLVASVLVRKPLQSV